MEENMSAITDKKSKKNNISITIPPEISLKLDILKKSTPISTTSGLISKILMDFFNNSEYMKSTIQIDSDAMLIPVNLYREVEGISPIGLQGRLDKGLIKIAKIGLADYVVEDQHSIKNIYLRLATINKQLKEGALSKLEFFDEFRTFRDETEQQISELKNTVKELQQLLPKSKNKIEKTNEE